MTDQEIAQTILVQLGGSRRLGLMIGATDFLADKRALRFRFKGCKKYSYAQITLDPSDTYTVKLYSVSRDYQIKNQLVISDVYVDRLRETIERETGLYLSLGTMGR